MIDPHLVEKESFTNIPNLRLFSSKIVYQIGIIKIYLIYFSQSAYPSRIITKLSYQPGFFNIKTSAGNTMVKEMERKMARIEDEIKQLSEKLALVEAAKAAK